MAKNAPTPGPYSLHRSEPTGIEVWAGELPSDHIATFSGYIGHVGTRDAHANARLFVAAQDLLEALENLVSAASGMPFSHDNLCQSTLDIAVEDARKAIAKSEDAS